jgi:hypothetical protein
METQGSLSSSQEPSTNLYLEPDQSSPYQSILSLSKIILRRNINPPTSILVFLVVYFNLAFPPIFYMHSYSPSFVLQARPISFSLTWSV